MDISLVKLIFGILAALLNSSPVKAAQPMPSCMIQLEGPEHGALLDIERLGAEDYLIAAGNGLFRLRTRLGVIELLGKPSFPDIRVSSPADFLQAVGESVVIGSADGAYFFDSKLSLLTKIDGDVGVVMQMAPIGKSKVLIAAANGLFLYSEKLGTLEKLGIGEHIYSLPEGTAFVPEAQLYVDGNGAYSLPQGLLQPHVVSDGSLLFETDRGAAVLDPLTKTISYRDDLWSAAADVRVSLGGKIVVQDNGKLFLVDGEGRREVVADDSALHFVNDLTDTDVMISTDAANYLVSPKGVKTIGPSDSVTVAPFGERGALVAIDEVLHVYEEGELVGYKFSTDQLGKGVEYPWVLVPLVDGALIGAKNGLYWINESPWYNITTITSFYPGPITDILPFSDRGAIIVVDRGIYGFELGGNGILILGSADILGQVSLMESKEGIPLAVLSDRKSYKFIETPLSEARVSMSPSMTRLPVGNISSEITVEFEHPCSSVAGYLNLTIRVSRDGERQAEQLARQLSSNGSFAVLAASFAFDRPGDWSLELLNGANPIGSPISLSVTSPSITTWLFDNAGLFTGAIAVLDILGFAILLAASGRSVTAFNLLTDDSSPWVRFLAWPLYLLRNLSVVQVWILAPWFSAVRRVELTSGIAFVEPIIEGQGKGLEASALLDRAKETKRLWLMGPSGMGKSSVFRQWKLKYFAYGDRQSLRASYDHFGFILIPIQVRAYAGLDFSTAEPEAWVLEIVRRAFAEAGMRLSKGLIDAMLRSGNFALALDGLNEADRDECVWMFARQFSRVRLLITSQSPPEGDWEVWRLPSSIRSMRDSMLRAWLGEEKAATLLGRIKLEGVGEVIVSGYDLRLFADLSTDDPSTSKMPRNRRELYLSMLDRARERSGLEMQYEPLRKLAWSMLVERRREIRAADHGPLGAGVVQALSADDIRVIRAVGEVHEFRHDQMRSFLAASWLVDDVPTIAARLEILTASEIFLINRRDQTSLWGFMAEIVESPDIATLWKYAGDEPNSRSIMLEALQTEADVRGISLTRRAKSGKSRAELQ